MTVIVWYAPAYRALGGLGFLTFVDSSRSIPVILFHASVGVWGIVGSLWLLIAAFSGIDRALCGPTSGVVLPRQIVLAALSTIVLETLLFLRLPHEAAYLIPVVPFVLLLLPTCVAPFIRKLVLTMIMASSCTFGFGPNANTVGRVRPSPLGATFSVAGVPLFIDPLQGPMWVEHIRRVRRTHYIQSVHRPLADDRTQCRSGMWLALARAAGHASAASRPKTRGATVGARAEGLST